MPAKSKAQRALFAMALAVRKGDMDKSGVDDEVMKIVNSDMTDKQLEDYAKTKGLKEQLEESSETERHTMKSLQECLTESLVTEGHDEDVLRKLCDKLPDDAWNPWKVFQIAVENGDDPDDLADNAEAEAQDMWDDDIEERVRALMDSPQYEKIVDAISKLKSPYKAYVRALMASFEDLL